MEKNKKIVSVVMKTLRIYSQQLSYVTAMLIALIILYIASLGLIYHITGSLCLLTPFICLPHPSGNCKSALFFSEFVFEV